MAPKTKCDPLEIKLGEMAEELEAAGLSIGSRPGAVPRIIDALRSLSTITGPSTETIRAWADTFCMLMKNSICSDPLRRKQLLSQLLLGEVLSALPSFFIGACASEYNLDAEIVCVVEIVSDLPAIVGGSFAQAMEALEPAGRTTIARMLKYIMERRPLSLSHLPSAAAAASLLAEHPQLHDAMVDSGVLESLVLALLHQWPAGLGSVSGISEHPTRSKAALDSMARSLNGLAGLAHDCGRIFNAQEEEKEGEGLRQHAAARRLLALDARGLCKWLLQTARGCTSYPGLEKHVDKCQLSALRCIRSVVSINILRPEMQSNPALLFDLAKLVTSGTGNQPMVAEAAGAIASILNFTECCLSPQELSRLLETGVIKALADQVGD